jgi:hypothetical protein
LVSASGEETAFIGVGAEDHRDFGAGAPGLDGDGEAIYVGLEV